MVWDEFTDLAQLVRAPGPGYDIGPVGDMIRTIGIDHSMGFGDVTAAVVPHFGVFALSADASSKGDGFIEWAPKVGVFDFSEFDRFTITGKLDHGQMLAALALYDGIGKAEHPVHIEGEFSHAWDIPSFSGVVLSHITAVRLDLGMERFAQDLALTSVSVDVPTIGTGALMAGAVVSLIAGRRRGL